jgi:3'-phosphoadenosine 5'-phosphosulfate sulfotransferase (PAPS reductase)/FAD synthetase
MSKRHEDMALVINMSGGKDSVYMLGKLCAEYPNAKKYVVMADTGFEHEKPISAVDWARQRCVAYGLTLYVVRNPNKTYLEMVERRGMFPSATTRQCTSDLKRGPIETWIRRAVKAGIIKEKIIINCTGIRAEESAARSKQKPLKRHKSLSKNGRIVWNWMPVFRATLDEVLAWHRETETPLHPVYVWAGGYLKRFSCRVCIFATDSDLAAIYEHDREAFDLVSSLEERTDFTMRADRSLVQIVRSGDAGFITTQEAALVDLTTDDRTAIVSLYDIRSMDSNRHQRRGRGLQPRGRRRGRARAGKLSFSERAK